MAENTCQEVLFTSCADGQLWSASAWDPVTGLQKEQYKGDSISPNCLSFLGNDYMIGSVPHKPILNVWLQGKEQLHSKMVCPGPITAMAVTSEGIHCIAAIGETLYVWNLTSGHLISTASRHYQKITTVKITDDNSMIVSGGEDSQVLIWNLSALLAFEGTEVEPLHTTTHSLPVTDLHLGCGGIRSHMVTASLDQTCKLWHLASGSLLCTYHFAHGISSVSMDSTETRLFAGSTAGHIHCIDVYKSGSAVNSHIDEDNNRATNKLTGHTASVNCLSISFDGLILASGSNDKIVKIWDTISCQCMRSIEHKAPITNVILRFSLSSHHALQPYQMTHALQVLQRNKVESDFSFDSTFSVRSSLRTTHSSPDSCQVIKEELEQDESNAVLKNEIENIKHVNKALYDFTLRKILMK